MSLRSVLWVIAFMLVVGTTAYVTLQNVATLQQPVRFWGGLDLPVFAVVAWAFLLGFLMTACLAAVHSGRIFLGRLREARDARHRERIERRYAQGLEALLGGSPERAEERFREVLERAPEHVETLLTMGEMLRGLGRAREAAELHRRSADLRPGDMRPLFALAADWNADGNLEKAREALERILRANPRGARRARRELRDLLVQARKWPEAGRIQEELEELYDKDSPERVKERRVGLGIRYEIAREAQARGALREAEKEYRAILKADPAFIPASLALGETLVAQGSAEDGVRAWRRGYEATQSPMFFARLEEHHLSREEPEVIIGLMRALVDSSRSRVVPLFYLGKLYLRLEMIDEAESTFTAVQNVAADLPVVKYYGAVLLERRGRLKEAAATYRRVIAESALPRTRYACRACRSGLEEPAARCPRCGDWNTIDVDLRELLQAAEAGTSLPTEWAAGA